MEVSMTTVEVMKLEEAGTDYLRLRDGDRSVRINLADDEVMGDRVSKEESAAMFRGLAGKDLAIPVDHSPFFIGMDLWWDDFGQLKVIPFPFATTSIVWS
jgi:hypothetical protein